jgi:hypothetical protein
MRVGPPHVEVNVSFHFIVRFEPITGKEPEFRRELLRAVETSGLSRGFR